MCCFILSLLMFYLSEAKCYSLFFTAVARGGKGSVGCLRVGPSLCGDAKRIVGFEESEMLCFIFVSMCPNRAEKCWLTQWEAVSSAGWR